MVFSFPLSLNNVLVSYWRYDNTKGGLTEFWNTGGCGSNRWLSTPRNANSPREAPEYIGCYNYDAGHFCPFGSQYWSWVDVDGLTHIFGDVGSNQSYPNGQLMHQIPPDSKEAMNGYSQFIANDNIDDQTGNKIAMDKPTLSIVTYLLPDTVIDNIDVEPVILWILCGYHNSGNLNTQDLTEYLAKTLFTPITGADGISKYAIVEFINNPNYSKNPQFYQGNTYIQETIKYWASVDSNGITDAGLGYCKGNNLSIPSGFCLNSCGTSQYNSSPLFYCDSNLTAFCQQGPNGTSYQDPESQIKFGDSIDKIKSNFPNSANSICGNFMPSTYYPAMDFASTNSDPKAGDLISQLVTQNFYKNPDCTGIGIVSPVHTENYYTQPYCPNVVVCLNELTVKGNFSNDKLNITQSNDCGNPPTPTPTPTPAPSIINKIIIASVVFIVLCILYFILLKLI